VPKYLHIDDKDVQPKLVGVIGANSLVGASLLPLLIDAEWQVRAFSRKDVELSDDGVVWRRLPSAVSTSLRSTDPKGEVDIAYWICLAPIWVLPEHFNLLEIYRIRRIVAVSSTSRFTKDESSDPKEQALARRFTKAEASLRVWAENSGIEWVILRPTLIYGLGRDKNITEIARFIHRFGFFPRFGKAIGLRQPIHVQDVASACLKALQMPASANKAYNISGGETLAYRDMVIRIFKAMGRSPLMLPVPLFVFRVAVALLRYFPRYRHWSVAMAERMNSDMVFDHSDAEQDLVLSPRTFVLSELDVSQREGLKAAL
jgi:uncharacterized protein YbjT (DUF2867 family)